MPSVSRRCVECDRPFDSLDARRIVCSDSCMKRRRARAMHRRRNPRPQEEWDAIDAARAKQRAEWREHWNAVNALKEEESTNAV